MMLRRSSKAFTMIEIMVVTVLIMGLLAMIGPKIARMFRDSAQSKIKFKMIGIKDTLNSYRLTLDTFPTTKQGLKALVTNPLPNNENYKRNANKWPFSKEDEIVDPAGNEFVYRCPPERFKDKYKFFELLYLGQSQSEDDPDFYDDGM